ncbi:glycosyltransferase [Actinomyces sp. 2119]|uniref:Glycosyltransferase n=1 Tax=Actinomyces lilanjuaniae TaxID=2321394 RepID=A0ABM6Z6F7_9ACTO|nr:MULTISPECIES: glycosyltransferase family 4 protein [Actinomyces]AYD90956.1 glycosyltransferase [Actinomyces lilanjuaniae]RJF41607.1 glycosyltransferase [Actinomyces sp. 2119]
MRVTVVTTWLPTTVAPSSGSFVVRDCRAIARAGQEVRIVHLVPPHQDDGTRRVTVEGLPVVRVPMRPASPASVAKAAAALPRLVEGTDVVHSMAMSSLLPLTLLDCAGVLTAPWVHTEHWSGLTNPGTLSLPLRAGRVLVSSALRRPDVVTAVCEYLAAPVRACRAEAPVVVVPCIVDPQGEPVPRRGERPGGDLDGTLRLVTVGGLVERKDPLACLEVLAGLVSRDVEATMTFVGEGPLRAAIEARAAQPDLAGRVRLTGTLDAAGVREELARADLFLGPTRGDNFFVSAAEAIVAGRPVVVSDAGGQTEYVEEGNGSIVAAGAAPAAWADAVVETRDRLAGASAAEVAATIGERFSTPVVGAAYRAVHEQVVGS